VNMSWDVSQLGGAGYVPLQQAPHERVALTVTMPAMRTTNFSPGQGGAL